ncbi:MAG: PaaI family thioesterase [Clostridia bacterium]|nr:PaaI family thioesterase [Clostridia bacterium]
MKVEKRQRNSRMCIMCGLDNPYGVRAPFYTMEDKSVVTLFQYSKEHQSYPNTVHGGLITAMLDEMGLRGMWAEEGGEITYGVTTSLQTKFRKPVPFDTPLVGRGQLYMNTGHFFGVHSSLYLADGTLLAEADVKYMKVPVDKLGGTAVEHAEMCYLIQDDVKEIQLYL